MQEVAAFYGFESLWCYKNVWYPVVGRRIVKEVHGIGQGVEKKGVDISQGVIRVVIIRSAAVDHYLVNAVVGVVQNADGDRFRAMSAGSGLCYRRYFGLLIIGIFAYIVDSAAAIISRDLFYRGVARILRRNLLTGK